MDYNFVKFEIYIPKEYFNELMDSLNLIDALKIGNYDSCIGYSEYIGHFRSLEESNPFVGEKNKLTRVNEIKVEFKCKKNLMEQCLSIIKTVHPYEEPVINIFPLLY